MITIDGSAGGSVTRIAVGLAAATDTPVRITDIRADRSDPGLRHQHCAGIRAAAALTDADVTGCEVGSDTVTFRPHGIAAGDIRVDVPTAGSVALVLQPLLIAACAADRSIDITVDGGATAGKWAPPVPTLQRTLLPLLADAGLPASVDVRRHGFYPAGGALVHATLGPATSARLDRTARGDLDRVTGVSLAATQLRDADVADRQRQAARRALKDANPSLTTDIDTVYVEAASPGSCIVLAAGCGDAVLGGDAVGEKGKRSERIGREAADDLLEDLGTGAAVDRHVADQAVPVLGCCGGAVTVPRLTDHVETAVRVTERLCDRSAAVDRATGTVTFS